VNSAGSGRSPDRGLRSINRGRPDELDHGRAIGERSIESVLRDVANVENTLSAACLREPQVTYDELGNRVRAPVFISVRRFRGRALGGSTGDIRRPRARYNGPPRQTSEQR
jgi:hypothetical protein